MTQQTELQRNEAHVIDTMSLLRDVAEANKIPEKILVASLLGLLYEETLKRSGGKLLGYVIKFGDLMDIFMTGSADFVLNKMKDGSLK